MVRGHPCPHQRRHCSTSRDGRAVVGVFQSVRFDLRIRPETGSSPGRARMPADQTLLISVPFRGFRGLQGDQYRHGMGIHAHRVSVPFRGFRGLQGHPGCCHRESAPSGVSVPFRGFRGLQAVTLMNAPRAHLKGFQSPSGVLGVCRLGCNRTGSRPPRRSFSPLPGF